MKINGPNEWNLFSCIHSTGGDPFDFIVYNSSHMLKNNETLNTSSRIRIKFPKKGSYFIVFHGRLIHNGAEAITDQESGKIIHSARMFSYLRVPDHNAHFNGNMRSSGRLKNNSINLNYNQVDRHSFQVAKDSLQGNHGQVIQLPPNFSIVSKHKINMQPVIGNMNLDGWEVYEGINFNSNELKGHSNEMMNLITDSPKNWFGISSTNRKMIVISSLEVMVSNIRVKYPLLYRAFKNLLENFLRRIPYLEEVEMDNQAILANMGQLEEQEPHRDYSSDMK